MIFFGFATDYDGTLARHGRVPESTVNALRQLRDSGRKLILVTGRILPELQEIFPSLDLFEWVVAENGGLLFCPQTREETPLTEAVPPEFPELLRSRGLENLQVGKTIVATWLPNECAVLGAIRDLGLDRQIVFNKDAVMVLPTGVNKGSGLTAALEKLRLSHHNTVSVGDAENDLPMLVQCEVGVAVANALDSVKKKADLVMAEDHGAGVEELIQALLDDDLAARLATVEGKGLLLGNAKISRDPVYLPSLGRSILVAGPSGSGKSTSITGLLERVAEAAYQFCILDPEGDYENFAPAVTLGNPHYVPSTRDVVTLLERMNNAVVNMLGVSLDERPQVASGLLRQVMNLRDRGGRPHWIVVDEAHHIFPAEVMPGSTLLPAPPKTTLMITVHPNHMRKEALESVDIVIAVGKDPHETIREFCKSTGTEAPAMETVKLEKGEVLLWMRQEDEAPFVVETKPGKTEHKRHVRKYAEGDLGPGSFVFRGPESKLQLVAQNLNTFIRMAEGVDDATWNHHLKNGEVSEWFRWIVKNEQLADLVRDIEKGDSSAEVTRGKVVEAIRSQYTSPA